MTMRVKVQTIRDRYKSGILQFFENIFVLKNLYRQGWIRYYAAKEEETESVADHIFSVAVLSYLFAKEHYPELDADKVLKLALFHEFGEVHAGDIPLSSITTQFDVEEKHRKEKDSVDIVFTQLKNRQEYVDLWEEFEFQKSEEAKFVQEMDKLEFLLQAFMYSKKNVIDMDLRDVIKRSEHFIKSDKLKNVLREIEEKI